jgi:hypothetical protein
MLASDCAFEGIGATWRGRRFPREGRISTMAVIALTDAQLRQVMTAAYQIPRALRRRYLERVSESLERSGLWRRRRSPGRACRGG